MLQQDTGYRAKIWFLFVEKVEYINVQKKKKKASLDSTSYLPRDPNNKGHRLVECELFSLWKIPLFWIYFFSFSVNPLFRFSNIQDYFPSGMMALGEKGNCSIVVLNLIN